MVADFKEVPLDDAKTAEDFDKAFREALGIGLSECSEALTAHLLENAGEMAEELINIAPYGDYEKVTEDKDLILKFLKEESSKVENWKLEFVDAKGQLMELVFFNKSIDDGDILKGFVFVGISGKIRHAFSQVSS